MATTICGKRNVPPGMFYTIIPDTGGNQGNEVGIELWHEYTQ